MASLNGDEVDASTSIVTKAKTLDSRHGPKPLSDRRIKLHKYSEKQALAMQHVEPQVRILSRMLSPMVETLTDMNF